MIDNLISLISNKKTYPFNTLYAYDKDKEFLALIFAEQPNLGYYYAHIAKHPHKNCWVSCLVYSSQFIIGRSVQHWLESFSYWIRVRLLYEPVSNKVAPYCYAESSSIRLAMIELQKMIQQFNRYAIYEEHENEYPSNPEILSFYGMENYCDQNGEYPPIPQYIERVLH
ncbi:hypothetical protein ACFGXB_04360 [Pasteurella multocida]